MLVDLPPDHPAVALSSTIHEVVANTPIGLALPERPTLALSEDLLGDLGTPNAGAAYDTAGNRVALRRPIAEAATRAGQMLAVGRRLNENQEFTVRTLVHEHLHAAHSTDLTDVRQLRVEEGAVEALAADLTAPVVESVSGISSRVTDTQPNYAWCVGRLRKLSAAATGQMGRVSWRAVPAFLWRMRLVMATPGERDRMIAAAGISPAEVC